MKIRAFITQHKAEKIAECQDRLSVNKDTKTVAISDGVSQSIFPDYWAQILVDYYTQNGLPPTEDDRIRLCKEWKGQVLQFIKDEKAKGNDPWRTESNLCEGISAGATLCGVCFENEKDWICEVIGDSCLIKVDKNNHIDILSSEDKKFDTYPDYLDSNPNKKGRGTFKKFSGLISEDDKLILVSDPFSDFFYNLKEQSANYIEQLLNIATHDEFVSLVSRWRESGMHNDDSTVIIIEWDNSSDFNIVSVDNLLDLIETEKKEAEKRIEQRVKINNVDDFKQKCFEQITPFVNNFTENEITSPKYTQYKQLLRYICGKKNKKTTKLSSFLEEVLKDFVETIK